MNFAVPTNGDVQQYETTFRASTRRTAVAQSQDKAGPLKAPITRNQPEEQFWAGL